MIDPSTVKIDFDELLLVEMPHAVLKRKRQELGLTQQQVANAAGIALRRYQKYEDGDVRLESASFQAGLSICAVLEIDPMHFCPIITKPNL